MKCLINGNRMGNSLIDFIDLAGDERTGHGMEESTLINQEKSILRSSVLNGTPLTSGDFCKYLRHPLGCAF
jgi:hypothetical protein